MEFVIQMATTQRVQAPPTKPRLCVGCTEYYPEQVTGLDDGAVGEYYMAGVGT